MKTFKKAVAVLLSVLLAFASVSLFAAAENEELKISVASDIHIGLKEKISDYFNDGSMSNKGSLLALQDEATAIFDSFLKESAASGVKYVLLPGDLTSSGKPEEFEFLSACLKKFEAETGIRVLVTPGNHDYFFSKNDGVKAFREAFSDFGFSEAFAIDEKTNSYAIDLEGGYTLLSIDSTLPGEGEDGITEELLSWVEAQAKAATERGRKLIAMMHHPLLPQFSTQEKFFKGYVVKDWKNISSKFADLGIKYVFTGHKHSADIAVKTSDLGNKIFNIGIPSLLITPLAYRIVTFSDEKVSVREKNITEIKDTSLLLKGYNDEAFEKVSKHTGAYADEFFDISFKNIIEKNLTAEKLSKLTGKDDEDTKAVFETVCKKTLYLMELPLYGEGETVQTIAKKYGLTLPETEYKTGFELLSTIAKAFCAGDENFPSDSPEMKLGLRCLAILLDYSLEGTSNDIRVLFIQAIMSALGADVTGLSVSIAALLTSLGNQEFGVAVVSAFIKPILEDFLVDSEPSDRNVDLPAYSKTYTKPGVASTIGFFEKIANFFMKLWNYLKGIFNAFSKK